MEYKKFSFKKYIDTRALERHYLSLCNITNKGKKCISVQTMERMMILEIYKSLCTGSYDNVDNGNQSRRD